MTENTTINCADCGTTIGTATLDGNERAASVTANGTAIGFAGYEVGASVAFRCLDCSGELEETQ